MMIKNLGIDLNFIEIETFSFCNRKCWFCTNQMVDRKTENKLLPISDYCHIIGQLKEIGFNGEISFSRYNEPLSHMEIILNRIGIARYVLGENVTLRINTNGDYLTAEYIDLLSDAGLDELWIQQYLGNQEKYCHDTMIRRIEKTLCRLNIVDYDELINVIGSKIEYNIPHEKMIIHIRGRNFCIDGSPRGGILPISGKYQRVLNCVQPSHNIYVDWNGSVMMCCEVRSELPQHKKWIMGNIKKDKIWKIFYTPEYIKIREIISKYGEKTGLCRHCKQGLTKRT